MNPFIGIVKDVPMFNTDSVAMKSVGPDCHPATCTYRMLLERVFPAHAEVIGVEDWIAATQ